MVPAARPVGGYTPAQVGAAYREVRALLIAAGLDWPTLRGGAPATFTRLLTAPQRTYFLTSLNKIGGSKDGYTLSTRNWVDSFAPGITQFISKVIKVHGAMSARSIRQNGRQVLRIQFNYLFVYAVAPPRDASDWMRVVDQNYGFVDFATWDDPGGALEPWLTQWNAGGPAGGRCDVHDGFIHPEYPSAPTDKVQPSGRPVDPYAMSTAGIRASCQMTTGT